MPSIVGGVCAVYRLPTARALDPDSCGLETPGFLKLGLAFPGSGSKFIDLGRQPAHSSHSVSRSVERAVGASHGTTGRSYKAVGEEADLVRLGNPRQGSHRRIRRSRRGGGYSHLQKRVLKVGCRRPQP